MQQQDVQETVIQLLEILGDQQNSETNQLQARQVLLRFNNNLERALNDIFEKGSLAASAVLAAPAPASSSDPRPVPPPPPSASSSQAEGLTAPAAGKAGELGLGDSTAAAPSSSYSNEPFFPAGLPPQSLYQPISAGASSSTGQSSPFGNPFQYHDTRPAPLGTDDPTRPPPYQPSSSDTTAHWDPATSWQTITPSSSSSNSVQPYAPAAAGSSQQQPPSIQVQGLRPNEPIDLTMDPADSLGGVDGRAGGEEFDEDLKRALEMSVHDMHQQQQSSLSAQSPERHAGNAGGDDDLARAIEMSIATSRQDPRYHQQQQQQQHGGAIDRDTEDQIRTAAAIAAAAERVNRPHQSTSNDSDQLVPIKLRPAPTQGLQQQGWPGQQSVNFADTPAQSAPGLVNLRPEVHVPLTKLSSASADGASANATPPTGLVASYNEAQSMLVMLQALYAVPAARKAILSWPLPDPRVRGRPEDLEGYWKGRPLAPVTAEEQEQKKGVVAGKERRVDAEDSGMGTDQVPGIEPQSSTDADANATDREVQTENVQESDTEMKEEAHEELTQLEALQAPHISFLQRVQTLFAYLQGTNRAWLQADDVPQNFGPNYLAAWSPALDAPLRTFSEISEAWNQTAPIRARLTPASTLPKDDDVVFKSQGGKCDGGTEPAKVEDAQWLTLHPSSLNTSVQTALFSQLSESQYLVLKPAKVMLLSLNHLRRAEKFTYDEILYLDPFVWVTRNGQPLPFADAEELERLEAVGAQRKKEKDLLSTFKGKPISDLLQKSVKYFELVAADHDSEDKAAAQSMMKKLQRTYDSFVATLQDLQDEYEKANEAQIATKQAVIDQFLDQANRLERQHIRYQLHAIIVRDKNSSFFQQTNRVIIRGEDGKWWESAPQQAFNAKDPGSIKKLTEEEVERFDTLEATAVLYGLCEEDDAERLWPTEKFQKAVEADNQRLALELQNLQNDANDQTQM